MGFCDSVSPPQIAFAGTGRYVRLIFILHRADKQVGLAEAGQGRQELEAVLPVMALDDADDLPPSNALAMVLLEPMLPKISRAVAHCFTGEHESLREYLAMGLWIGVTGWICDERRGKHLHDIVPIVPDDRLLIETDAPYLLPRTLTPKPKSRRNEPAYLTEVLRVVAAARGQSEEHVARITTENANRFFDLD